MSTQPGDSIPARESWKQALAKARRRFKKLAKGRCLSQELIEERSHER